MSSAGGTQRLDAGAVAEGQVLLVEITEELARLGLLESEPPSTAALNSTLPFCVDTLRFEQWLQWLALPRLRLLVERGGTLPHAARMAAMSEYSFAERGLARETLRLTVLISALDRLLSPGPGPGPGDGTSTD